MRIGTSYFIDRQSAIKYYKEYHYQNTEEAVDRKLKDGEIHIGKPEIQDTEYLKVNEEGRYIRVDR
jgi:hypothetical protein